MACSTAMGAPRIWLRCPLWSSPSSSCRAVMASLSRARPIRTSWKWKSPQRQRAPPRYTLCLLWPARFECIQGLRLYALLVGRTLVGAAKGRLGACSHRPCTVLSAVAMLVGSIMAKRDDKHSSQSEAVCSRVRADHAPSDAPAWSRDAPARAHAVVSAGPLDLAKHSRHTSPRSSSGLQTLHVVYIEDRPAAPPISAAHVRSIETPPLVLLPRNS